MIDIIMTTHNRLRFLKRMLGSLFEKSDGIPYRLFIIDDCSMDGTAEYLSTLNHKNLCHVALSKKRNGVCYGFNALWGAVERYDEYYERFPFLCYLQDDMEILESGWLRILVDAYKTFKEKHNIGFFSGYDCIEHPNITSIQWNGKKILFKKSSGFPNVMAEKDFWKSIGYIPRLNPNGDERGLPSNGKGSHIDLWFTGCYSQSRFNPRAAAPNCSYNQKKIVMVIPMMRHLGQTEGSTWADEKRRSVIKC